MRLFRFRPWTIIGASIVILAVAGAALRWHGNSRLEEFKNKQGAIMTDSARGAAATISREVGRLHVATALFAKQQSQLLHNLAEHPDDAELKAELKRRIDAVFNSVISFSLVDEFGALLLPNPQQIIGPRCQNDIARYVITHSGDPNAVYTPSTHFTRDGNKFDQHFDIIVKNPEGGFFFLGIHAATLQQLLKLHELPGHQLVLLSGDKTLNEDLTVDTGLRSAMDLPPLNADEIKQLHGLTPIPNTSWKLAARPRPGFYEEAAADIWRDMFAYWLAFSAAALLFLALWVHERNRRVRIADINTSLILEIKERRKAEERLQVLTRYDPLTGLSNRQTAEDYLRHVLASARRTGRQAALLFFDLDHFKDINDSLGHGYGDQVLKQAADRLSTQIREEDMLARWGGDEFIVILPHVEGAGDAASFAVKLIGVMHKPFNIGNQEVRTTISIGIAVYPHSGKDPETLIKNADLALYRAKWGGRNRFQFFSSDMDDEMQFRVRQEKELRMAIARGEFEVYFQPRLNLASGRISSAEALLRWNHPEQGLLAPDAFLKTLEGSNLIEEVGDWVMGEVCKQTRRWREEQRPSICISINLSGREFSQSNLVERLSRHASAQCLARGLLELEITETFLMEHTGDSLAKLNALRKLGFRLAIDDFGTGYSSLAYLKRFPIQTLKIDQSFVRHIHEANEDREIVRTIIALARTLNLTTVAEGVESEEQLRLVHEMGCDEAQGYAIARPLPAGELEKLLAAGVNIGNFGSPAN
ncbi:MAG: EAL domain-containing protein [Pseudomonadota bacterium]